MFVELSHSLALAGLVIALYMIGWYLVALIRRDLNVADIAWGPGFILASLAVLWRQSVVSERQLIVMGLVAIWGMRLAVHIFLRNWGRSEDWRYARRRKHWTAPAFFHTFWEIFVAQGFLMGIILLPVISILTFRGTEMGTVDWIGVGFWIVGFLLEIIADYQLARFQSSHAYPRQRLSSGLWIQRTRPNYVGEAMMWWGIWLMALSVPSAWWTVLGPLTITLILLKAHRAHIERKRK